MNADNLSPKHSSSARLLVFTLFLAVLAGGAALYWHLESSPANVPGAIGPAEPGGSGPSGVAPNSVTGTVTGNAPDTAPGLAKPLWSATDQKAASPAGAGDSAPPDEKAGGPLTGPNNQQDNQPDNQPNNQPDNQQDNTRGDAAGNMPGEERGSAQGNEKADGNGRENSAPGVILYGKGKPVNPEGSAVRGSIPSDQAALSGSMGGSGAGARGLPRGDSLIGPAFVEDLAAFLADNYWPEGTHPMAVGRGLTTADVKWTNLRYGVKLAGFSLSQNDPPAARQRILAYAYTPSMLRALYRLHAENFFLSLERQALNRASGPQGQYFNNVQVASLFAEYARMARALAACAALMDERPGLWDQASAYAADSSAASLALDRFISGMDGDAAARQEAEAVYYAAVQRRESSRNLLAAALNNGDARALDADSRIYAALWLHRRGRDNHASLAALREIFTDAAGRLEGLAARYASLPARQIARP